MIKKFFIENILPKMPSLSDMMLYFSIYVMWNIPVTLLKNYYFDSKRVGNPYLTGMPCFIQPHKEKLHWKPVNLDPPKEEHRDLYLSSIYEDRIEKISNSLVDSRETVRRMKECTKFDTSGFDHEILKLTKKQQIRKIEEKVYEVIPNAEPNENLKEEIRNRYLRTNYKFKNELYKELLELVDL